MLVPCSQTKISFRGFKTNPSAWNPMASKQRGPTQRFRIRLTKRYYERAVSQFNPLIAEACKYAPHPHPLLRRPRTLFWILTTQSQPQTPNIETEFIPQFHDTLAATVRGGEASSNSRHVSGLPVVAWMPQVF